MDRSTIFIPTRNVDLSKSTYLSKKLVRFALLLEWFCKAKRLTVVSFRWTCNDGARYLRLSISRKSRIQTSFYYDFLAFNRKHGSFDMTSPPDNLRCRVGGEDWKLPEGFQPITIVIWSVIRLPVYRYCLIKFLSYLSLIGFHGNKWRPTWNFRHCYYILRRECSRPESRPRSGWNLEKERSADHHNCRGNATVYSKVQARTAGNGYRSKICHNGQFRRTGILCREGVPTLLWSQLKDSSGEVEIIRV